MQCANMINQFIYLEINDAQMTNPEKKINYQLSLLNNLTFLQVPLNSRIYYTITVSILAYLVNKMRNYFTKN